MAGDKAGRRLVRLTHRGSSQHRIVVTVTPQEGRKIDLVIQLALLQNDLYE